MSPQSPLIVSRSERGALAASLDLSSLRADAAQAAPTAVTGGAPRAVGSFRRGRRARAGLHLCLCGLDGEAPAVLRALDVAEEGVFVVTDPDSVRDGQCLEVLLPLPRAQGLLRAVARVIWRGYKGEAAGVGMHLSFADAHDAHRWAAAVDGWARHHQLAQLALLRRMQRRQRKRAQRKAT
jgi:hypothetical protein